MSDATYRIDVSRTPHSDHWPWEARIYRLSDDMLVQMLSAAGSDLVREQAQLWIKAENARADGFSIFVDDQGEPVEQHSVKTTSETWYAS